MDTKNIFALHILFCSNLLYNGKKRYQVGISLENQKESTTIDYYNKNAERFYTDTVKVAFSAIQDNFAKYLKDQANILDFGCGSGRDSKAFKEKGYKVDAIDGSVKMCRLAEKLLGQKVPCIRFQDFSEVDKYDGIWACASVLHLEAHTLHEVFIKIREALKMGGYLYTSFKYGEFSGLRNGRYFIDMTEESFSSFIRSVGGFDIIEMEISTDARPGREDERWINIILRKSIIQ